MTKVYSIIKHVLSMSPLSLLFTQRSWRWDVCCPCAAERFCVREVAAAVCLPRGRHCSIAPKHDLHDGLPQPEKTAGSASTLQGLFAGSICICIFLKLQAARRAIHQQLVCDRAYCLTNLVFYTMGKQRIRQQFLQ